jgi:lipid II:glycine glycyltransferase (peptidoglycan interpeptide bridge formation enzyme)
MATIFQTPEWEKFKLKTGWQKSWRVFDILVLEKKIPLLGSMLYAPMATRDQTRLATQKIFLDQINKIATAEGAFFFRLESSDAISEAGSLQLEATSYRKAFEEMQPEHTLLIDLSKSESDILGEMKQKGRYNIKIAGKHGVKVSTGEVKDFYQLYQAMAKRQKITYRNENYFQKLVDILGEKDYARVFVAKTGQQSVVSSQQNDTANRKPNPRLGDRSILPRCCHLFIRWIKRRRSTIYGTL